VPWLIYMCAYVCNHSFIWVTRLIYIVPWLNENLQQCFIGSHIHLYTPRFVHMRVTWLINMCAMTHLYVCHHSFMWVTWLIDTCAMTHSKSAAVHRWQPYTLGKTTRFVHTWLTCPINMCAMTHLYVCQYRIHMCDTTHSCVCHDSLEARRSASLAVIYTCRHLYSFISEWHDSYSYVWHDSFICV